MPLKEPKTIFSAKREDAVDHSRVIRCFKKFRSNCFNLDDQSLGRPNLSNIQRVPGELGI